jgi:hypothetical protein
MRLLAALLLALVVTPVAHGKGCARIAASSVATLGNPVLVTLTTLREVDGSERLQPYHDRIVALSVYAQSYSGRVWTFRVTRDRTDPTRWRGRIVFPHPGVWWLRSTASSATSARCNGKARVLVRRR